MSCLLSLTKDGYFELQISYLCSIIVNELNDLDLGFPFLSEFDLRIH